MRFTKFVFKNFKGIEHIELNLSRTPNSNVFTLVGLNESGKTTILEAINYFTYKTETLQPLELDRYKIADIHELIPIPKRANFNGFIEIYAELELDEEDENLLKKYFKKEIEFELTKPTKKITYTQKYRFENSKHIKEKDQFLWSHNFYGKKKRAKSERKLNNDEALKSQETIKSFIPSILYFPNFLFEFPDKIFLEKDKVADAKHEFYRIVIQDILDSLDNDLDLETHILKRAKSEDHNDKKHLASVLDKMSTKVTDVIFDAWDKIFNRKFSKKEISIRTDNDPAKGHYLEFVLKDSDGIYLINERSLGFRWFFVFLLLTQFRGHRKNRRNVLFLFDEPASNLHSTAQNQLLKSFSKLQSVIYTTHSHHLINPHWLESTFVVKNEGLTYENEDKDFISSMTKISIFPYRTFVSKYPNQTSYFQPVLDVLDYAPSKLEIIPNSILLEGKLDYYTFNYYKEIISTSKLEFNFIPGTGSSNLENLISLNLGWGYNFILLLDSDKAGKAQKSRYLELYGKILEDRIFTYENIDEQWKNFGSEKIFTLDDKLLIQKTCFHEEQLFNKSLFNKSLQELLIKGERVNISQESINNFEKIFNFLKQKLGQ